MAKNHGNKPLFSVGMSFDEVGPLRAMVGGWREGSLNLSKLPGFRRIKG